MTDTISTKEMSLNATHLVRTTIYAYLRLYDPVKIIQVFIATCWYH